MNRNNPATEHFRKDSDRYDQIPKWATRSGVFFTLKLIESKLYVFFISKSDKHSRATPRYSVCALAEKINTSRKYIHLSILTLVVKGLIATSWKGRGVQVSILFDPPTGREDSLNLSHLNAKPLNRRSPSETGVKISPKQGHIIPESGTSCPTEWDKKGQMPDWDIPQTPINQSGDYEPGADTEELK